jgi:glycosyltransferase involved in cell wall biosynthesis
METRLYSRLVMLGAAGETRGSIGSVVEAYRAFGMFKRWPVDYIPLQCGNPFETLAVTARALQRFAGLLAQHRRIALHVHSVAQASFWRDCAFMAIAQAARCPVVLQLHGGGFDLFHDASSSVGRATIRFALERAAHVIVPSESLRAWTRSITRRARVSCIPSPVTLPAAVPASERQPVVLFLGRIEQSKGVFELLESVAALRGMIPAQFSDLRLVCAGEGDRAAVARYARRLGIEEAVKFTGWVGPSGKRALMETAAAFVLPSHTAGLPVSLLEAMAAGVPVIASPIGGIPEVLVDGVTGFFAAPGDTATLTRLLRKVLADRALAGRIGAAARESVRLRFSPERTIPRLEEIYAQIGVAELGQPMKSYRDHTFREAA